MNREAEPAHVSGTALAAGYGRANLPLSQMHRLKYYNGSRLSRNFALLKYSK